MHSFNVIFKLTLFKIKLYRLFHVHLVLHMFKDKVGALTLGLLFVLLLLLAGMLDKSQE